MLDESAGEGCDLGSANDNQGYCTQACTVAACGDGFVGPGEACDDGNLDSGDGCDPPCQVEPGWVCDLVNCFCDEGFFGEACLPCPDCGGTGEPGTCPFAGADPFRTRFNSSFDRSNRTSNGNGQARGESPFGAFPSFEDDFFAEARRSREASRARSCW